MTGNANRKQGTRTSFERVRRADLIEAAYQTFLEFGMSGMTMARIGERAGMSHGIVNYYFKRKDELLSAVVRRANSAIIVERAKLLRDAKSSRERLSATIAASFMPDLFTCEISRAWVSYYSAIGKYPEFERVQNVVDQRLLSNLRYDLRHLTSPQGMDEVATCVALLIDGLWLRHAKSGSALQADEAIRLVEAYVDERLARHRE